MGAPSQVGSESSSVFMELEKSFRDLENERNLRVLHAGDLSHLYLHKKSEAHYANCRFIYIRSIEHYLSLFPVDETVDVDVNVPANVSGWDLKKTLIALLKGNPEPLDWVQLRDPYAGHDEFPKSLISFALEHCDPVRFALYHYNRIERQKHRFDGVSLGEIVPERLYDLIRSSLVLRWYNQNRYQGVPPSRLSDIAEATFIRPVLRGEIEELVERSEAGMIKDVVRPAGAINDLILAELEAGPALLARRRRQFTQETAAQADRFFLKWAVVPKN
ncbi:DNA polymerase beta superfamily protein [Pseudovibrio ascidiaceicola]|uniref:DNA polymerase beta superfamily protein n=1 Tax=Pseudovibrio ascidiaceicola TaxID=285279 RepID=UPI001AD8F522|nr:nucleotidyltransferase domain-containing protein [Pseudovibrio ascidiaceicola]